MSDGHCEVDFTDYSDEADPVEFHQSTIVKRSRKAHRCDECGGEIAVGESYLRTAYVFEGKFDVDRVCDPCREAAGEFGWHIIGGSLWEMFREEWDNGANLQGCLNRLESARAKEHMRRQWAKWQDAKLARTAQRRTPKPDAVARPDGIATE